MSYSYKNFEPSLQLFRDQINGKEINEWPGYFVSYAIEILNKKTELRLILKQGMTETTKVGGILQCLKLISFLEDNERIIRGSISLHKLRK